MEQKWIPSMTLQVGNNPLECCARIEHVDRRGGLVILSSTAKQSLAGSSRKSPRGPERLQMATIRRLNKEVTATE